MPEWPIGAVSENRYPRKRDPGSNLSLRHSNHHRAAALSKANDRQTPRLKRAGDFDSEICETNW